ncbi:MAG: bifunctional folylpolyglutamate synthase/dihydrofolate synthase [Clostridia bacterium]|nr:bifunctional folylpolyglutamate synthase/dihydrofolate synthase [Clostridia bacterium]
MNKNEALSFIHGTLKFGSVLGLDSIKNLMEYLGNPQKGMKFIHVAGTNGKGSVCSMLSEMLISAGYNTGLYTSPALVNFNERIRLNGKEISDSDLALCTEKVKEACEKMEEEGLAHPTEFEIVTAIAFLYYKMKKADIVVLEVGMGGRLDATNIIENPLVTVITSISLDHTDRLGSTIAEIAGEKCGIIKKGSVTVTSAYQNPEALSVIEKTAENLIVAKKPQLKDETLSGLTFDYANMENLFLSLTGIHQLENVSIAIAVAKVIGLFDDDIRNGLKNVTHPARMEVIRENPPVILDGAHNPSAMGHLKENVKKFLKGHKKTLIIGMLRDKDYEECAALIGCEFDRIITVDVPGSRALPKEELAEVMKKYCNDVTSLDLKDAAAKIDESGAFVIAGSLYMAGEFKEKYQHLI